MFTVSLQHPMHSHSFILINHQTFNAKYFIHNKVLIKLLKHYVLHMKQMLINCSVIKTITTNLFIVLKLERVYCDLGLKQASFFQKA